LDVSCPRRLWQATRNLVDQRQAFAAPLTLYESGRSVIRKLSRYRTTGREEIENEGGAAPLKMPVGIDMTPFGGPHLRDYGP
jgi:hypothetical protein